MACYFGGPLLRACLLVLLHMVARSAWSLTAVQEAVLVDEVRRSDSFFGQSVDLQGDVAVLGTNDRTAGIDRSAAVLFKRTGTTWELQTKLVPADAPPAPFKTLAAPVALDGDLLVLGAFDEEEGAAFVYERTASGWVQRTKLRPEPHDFEFGFHVDIDGETVLVSSAQGSATSSSGGRQDGLVRLGCRT